jgi:hypothetical protein
MFKQAFVLILGVFAVGLTASQGSQAFSPQVDSRAAQPVQATSATYYQTYLWRDFQPFQSSVNVSFTGDNADRRLYITSGGGEVTTRLQLPQGAQVTEVTYFYFDNTPAPQDLGMSITGESLATGQTTAVGSTAPTITSTSMMSATFTISPALVINNSQFSYEIHVGLYAATPNLGFRGARIGYTVPTVWLPLINRQ